MNISRFIEILGAYVPYATDCTDADNTRYVVFDLDDAEVLIEIKPNGQTGQIQSYRESQSTESTDRAKQGI